MNLKITKDRGDVIISLPENFGFSVRNDFRKAMTGNPKGTRYFLDFKEVQRIESSALGMMLMLRETAGGGSADISVINSGPEVSKILQLAQFHKLFKMR